MTEVELDALMAYWEEIKSRSMRGVFFCGDCWFAFTRTHLPCSKHATADEKKQINDALTKLVLRPHPFFSMTKKESPEAEREPINIDRSPTFEAVRRRFDYD